MEKLVSLLKRDHPDLVFSLGHSHCWSPKQGEISYSDTERAYSIEGLLHELGHARLRHQGYISDLELLRKEVEAWQEAEQMAKLYDVTINQDHVQDCLDTYRDWIYKRSMCPTCKSTGLQQNEKSYICLNCGHGWRVTASRFCRPYRRSSK